MPLIISIILCCAAFWICFFISLFPAAILSTKLGLPNIGTSVLLSLIFIPMFYGIIYLINKKLDKKSWASMGWQNWRRGVPLLLIGFICASVLISLQNYFGEFLGLYERVPPEEEFTSSLGLTSLAILALGAISSSGFVEELAFRGYILRNTLTHFSKPIAILISSVLFAIVVHINKLSFEYFFSLVAIGALLALLFLKTRSLWFVIGFHWSYNWTQSVLWGSGKRAFFRISETSKPIVIGTLSVSSETIITIGGAILFALIAFSFFKIKGNKSLIHKVNL